MFSVFQSKRLGALNKFKSKDRSLLIATDVASRGLDIPHVDVVINFDIPTHSKVKKMFLKKVSRLECESRGLGCVLGQDSYLSQPLLTHVY